MNNPSSFSSISFEAEMVKRFKMVCIKEKTTHTECLKQLLDLWCNGRSECEDVEYFRMTDEQRKKQYERSHDL